MRVAQRLMLFLAAGFGIGGTIIQLGSAEGPLESLSYFTTLSNAFAGVVFALALVDVIRREHVHAMLVTFAHTAAVALIVTFFVYHFALRPTLAQFDELYHVGGPLDLSLHYITPAFSLCAYLLLPFQQTPWWKATLKPLFFPFAYLGYVMVYVTAGGRFTLDGVQYRQPYFFLDVETYGIFTVGGFIVGLTVIFATIAVILNTVKRRLKINDGVMV